MHFWRSVRFSPRCSHRRRRRHHYHHRHRRHYRYHRLAILLVSYGIAQQVRGTTISASQDADCCLSSWKNATIGTRSRNSDHQMHRRQIFPNASPARCMSQQPTRKISTSTVLARYIDEIFWMTRGRGEVYCQIATSGRQTDFGEVDFHVEDE